MADAVRPLALHQMTALDVPATELVAIADEIGCEHVCVFVHVPRPEAPFGPITDGIAGELEARLRATGVTVTNVEFFPLTADVELESFRAPLELGARLGGTRLVTIVDDPVRTRAVEHLARLCDLAAEYGMDVGLEFMGMTPGCTSLAAAAEMIRLAERRNLGFDVDCLHLVRSGGSAADVAALPAELFAYAQICDGLHGERRTEYTAEAFERTVPGEGVFPIAEILDALPAATPVDVEVPSLRAQQRAVPALQRARRATTAARKLLAAARPTR